MRQHERNVGPRSPAEEKHANMAAPLIVVLCASGSQCWAILAPISLTCLVVTTWWGRGVILESNRYRPAMLLNKHPALHRTAPAKCSIICPKLSIVPRLSLPALSPLHYRVSFSKQGPAELTVSLAESSSRDGRSAHGTRYTAQAPCSFLIESNRTSNALLILKIASFGTLNWKR